jgi:hypothetical protein
MFSLIAALLALAGLGLILIGFVFFLIAAFRESVLWGLGVLFLSPVSLVFLIVHWDRAKQPFFLQLYGFGALLVAVLLSNNNLPWPLG